MTGIYRATPLRVNPRQRTVKSVYKTYIDVIHFRKADSRRLRGREEEEGDEGEEQGEGLKKTFTAERIEQLKQLSKAPDIYERLSRALGEKKSTKKILSAGQCLAKLRKKYSRHCPGEGIFILLDIVLLRIYIFLFCQTLSGREYFARHCPAESIF